MAIDLAQFRATFFVEASEHLAQMENSLLLLENSPHDTELLNTIFRAAHSIKGASTTFGMEDIGRFTHVLESLLERLREGVVSPTGQLIEVLLSSVDVLQGLLTAAKEEAPLPHNLESVLAELKRIDQDFLLAEKVPHRHDLEEPCADKQAVLPITLPPQAKTDNRLLEYRIEFAPSRDFFRFGQDPLLLLQELHDMGTVRAMDVDDRDLPPLGKMDPESCYLRWTITLLSTHSEQSISDVFMFLDGDSRFRVVPLGNQIMPEMSANNQPEGVCPPAVLGTDCVTPPMQAAPATPEAAVLAPSERRTGEERRVSLGGAENETVRVDRHRLDELINQIGELVIGASMVEQEVLSAGSAGASAAMLQLAKIVRDLQEMSLSLRMVPIAATFQKMNRIVRDLAKKLGKQVNLQTEGEDTELDKSVVDQIGDPLVHMVRNAVDHGLETSDVRRQQGKPETGKVTLRAYQQGGNIFIDVEDDGKGLDRKALHRKALERGLIDESQVLSDSDICNLIFHPGFSTAATITDVSGRGVGMDVVRRNVESLQGSVSIRSVEGVGSTLTIRLPLTLAILDGLLVRLRQEVYIIPLLSVVESIRVDASQIRRIPSIGEVIMLRGEVVPIVRLSHVLQRELFLAVEDHGLLVIVEDQGRRFAMMVDDLLGQQQVVIKNLETNLHKVPGVAGATILGDGRVALILDIFGVACLSQQTLKPSRISELSPQLVVEEGNSEMHTGRPSEPSHETTV